MLSLVEHHFLFESKWIRLQGDSQRGNDMKIKFTKEIEKANKHLIICQSH